MFPWEPWSSSRQFGVCGDFLGHSCHGKRAGWVVPPQRCQVALRAPLKPVAWHPAAATSPPRPSQVGGLSNKHLFIATVPGPQWHLFVMG